MRRFTPAVLLIAAYAALLIFAALVIPLRIPEILQLAGSRHFTNVSLARWIAQVPDSAPLNYFVQLPFVALLGYSRFAARLPSLLFAIGSCILFLRLVRRIPLQRPVLALLVFMLLPFHLQFATDGTQFEQALFLLLFATEFYFRLVERPTIVTSALYGLLLISCLYTDRYSYLPAVGYLLFLFRFVNNAQQRRTLWFTLPATVLPVLLFLPYYFWAHPHVRPYWLSSPPQSSAMDALLYDLRGLAGAPWAAYVLLPLLLAGVIGGTWASFRRGMRLSKRILLFCLLGGVVSTLGIAAVMDSWMGEVFSSSQVLWIAPGIVALTFAAFEWWGKKAVIRPLAAALAILLLSICAVGDAQYLASPTEDVHAEATSLQPELTGDSCIVFVSERFSSAVFLLFDPELAEHECLNFFHKRVILASHPYVRPDQQSDAESFFRGLNFSETKRVRVGAGQIVVMEQSTATPNPLPVPIPH